MEKPEIIEIESKELVGIKVSTSLADDKTSLLWNRFMKYKEAIITTKSDDLYSVQIYGKEFISGDFDSQSEFEKWAAMEVEDNSEIPRGLEKLILPSGTYAIFTHEGTAKEFAKTSKFIFEEWIPSSDFEIDDRPHFEVLGKEYKGPENPSSKEKIWIPVKPKD